MENSIPGIPNFQEYMKNKAISSQTKNELITTKSYQKNSEVYTQA